MTLWHGLVSFFLVSQENISCMFCVSALCHSDRVSMFYHSSEKTLISVEVR
jgi:hypothetical protein